MSDENENLNPLSFDEFAVWSEAMTLRLMAEIHVLRTDLDIACQALNLPLPSLDSATRASAILEQLLCGLADKDMNRASEVRRELQRQGVLK